MVLATGSALADVPMPDLQRRLRADGAFLGEAAVLA